MQWFMRTKYLVLFSFFTIAFLFTPRSVHADTVIFDDNFDDNDVSDWSVVRNTCSTGWTVGNGQYGINIPSPCITETIPNSLNIPTNENYKFEVDMYTTPSANMDRNFVFKYLNSSNWYGIHTLGSNLYLHKVVNGTEYFLTNWHTTYPFADGQKYHFSVEVSPAGYSIFINNSFHTYVPESGITFESTKAGLQASAGGVSTSQVAFDNILVTLLDSTPSPSPTPTATPVPTPTPTASPTPTPTPILDLGLFDLPFEYPDRGVSQENFVSNFWDKLTALFDHQFTQDDFVNFMGEHYANCTVPLSCYDSHNGTDFSNLPNDIVLSPSVGKVVYVSDHDQNSCTPDAGGYGCIVVVKYQKNNYGLFAHLSKIFVDVGQNLNSVTQIGLTGTTGCGTCGKHLHFGVLRPKNIKDAALSNYMRKNDWKFLAKSSSYEPYCSYRSPLGVSFVFTDPTGWSGNYKDPWSLPKKKSGCSVVSKYLWRYNI